VRCRARNFRKAKIAQRQNEKLGFTLIEMSIVLTIVGLIIGAIFVGQTLIRQTQITSVAMDEQRYVQVALQFQQKYGMLPGDFANATNFWGAMTTCPPTYGTASQGGTLTCNGNGNGQIETKSEYFLFWQHLANAQMIQGYYTGIAGSAGIGDHVIGANCPQSRVEGAGFCIGWSGVLSGASYAFDGSYGHVMTLGSYFANRCPNNPALTAREAQAFDSKYDDGLPAYGNVRTFKNGNPLNFSPNCATTAVSSTAQYNITTTGPQCSLWFITGF
jgi:prepilin-type N-terminal cleavage/methylation domain-containing protein